MSRIDDERLQQLEQALLEAHRARRTPSWDTGWAMRVMQRVRRVARQQARVSQHHDDVLRLVWKTAGVAVVLALLVGLTVMMGSSQTAIQERGVVADEVDLGSLFLE
jgi:hypothetical protein